MTKRLLILPCLSLSALLSGCATTTQSTAMTECPPGGCVQPLPQREPPGPEVRERASRELACPDAQIVYTSINESTYPGSTGRGGPWEAVGCGQRAIYKFYGGFPTAERITFVEKVPAAP